MIWLDGILSKNFRFFSCLSQLEFTKIWKQMNTRDPSHMEFMDGFRFMSFLLGSIYLLIYWVANATDLIDLLNALNLV